MSEKKQVEYKKSLIVIFIFIAIGSWVYYSFYFGKNKQLEFTERTEKVLNKFNNSEVLYCSKVSYYAKKGSNPIEAISNKDWIIDGYKFFDKKDKYYEFLECEN